MFCETCGHELDGNEAFCGACGAPVNMDANQVQTVGTSTGLDTTYVGGGVVESGGAVGKRLTVRVILALCSLAIAVVGVLFLTQLVSKAESVVDSFWEYDSLAAGIGTAAYVLSGVLFALFSLLACIPLARTSLIGDTNDLKPLSRGMVFAVILLLLCISIWVLKLFFRTPAGSDAVGIIYYIAATYGETAVPCLALTGGSLVGMAFVRALA